jgi:hypothetical protein
MVSRQSFDAPAKTSNDNCAAIHEAYSLKLAELPDRFFSGN